MHAYIHKCIYTHRSLYKDDSVLTFGQEVLTGRKSIMNRIISGETHIMYTYIHTYIHT